MLVALLLVCVPLATAQQFPSQGTLLPLFFFSRDFLLPNRQRGQESMALMHHTSYIIHAFLTNHAFSLFLYLAM